MNERKSHTSYYTIVHSITEPTRMSDYDYDPMNPERRFISGYIHKLEFYDTITDSILCQATFSSLACADIISGLYKAIYGSPENGINNPGCLTTIQNIIVPGSYNPSGTIMIYQLDNKVYFSVFTSQYDKSVLTFEIPEVQILIDLLENDEMDDLYVIDSSDRNGEV